jgi:hypothetical protein
MIDAHRSNQKWIFWLLLITATIYLVMTLNWILTNQQQRQKLDTTLEILPLLLPVQQLTQQLQTERAMFAGFATTQLPLRPPLELQQLQTDAAWRDLNLFIINNMAITQTAAEYLSALPKQQMLFQIRQSVYDQQISSTEVKRAYSRLLHPLMDLAEHIQLKNELSGLTKPLSAIVALTEAMERAGQERVTILVAFAEQQMSASRYQSYVILVNEQMDYLRQFSELVSSELQQQWRVVQSQYENGAFIELREQALAQEFNGDVSLWFSLANARIDNIYQLRRTLCVQLIQQSQSIDKQLNSIFQQLLLQLQWLLIIFLLLAWRLYRLYYGIRPQLKPVRPSPGFN